MNDGAKKRLWDAAEACDAIAGFVEGKEFTVYEADHLLRSGVERQLEIIGEALGRAAHEDETVAWRIPELRGIVGLRNRLIHGYDTVDDEVVWDIVQGKLPALRAGIEALLG